MSDICSERFLNPLSSPFILSTVCHVITVFGFPLHIFGAYCIFAKTPERMKQVNMSMLMMHISIVVMNFIESFLVIPFAMVPVLAGAPLGLLDKIGVPRGIQFNIVVTGPAVAGISVLAVFESRYFVLTASYNS